MNIKKGLLILAILPLTLILDLALYAFVKTCPTCGSFWAWLKTEGALSFPLIIGLAEWFSQIKISFSKRD